MHIFQLLKTLIDIPSITGGEAAICVFLSDYLEQQGWQVVRQELGSGRCNIYAAAGKPRITFSTHMDTVPPYLPFSEDGSLIYGRGACDAKGSLAVQIAAARQLRTEGIDVGLLFVAGEERGSDGALAANSLANESRFIINGEPTVNVPATGTKGVLRARLHVSGVAAHSACPDRGSSAILKLLRVLHRLNEQSWPVDSELGETTLNIGTISGGRAGNVIPDAAEAEIMFRTVTPSRQTLAGLEEICAGEAAVEVLYRCEPVKMICPDGYQGAPVSFATDITSLTSWGEPLLLGPGSIHDAHSNHEKVAKNDLKEAVRLYTAVTRQLIQKTG